MASQSLLSATLHPIQELPPPTCDIIGYNYIVSLSVSREPDPAPTSGMSHVVHHFDYFIIVLRLIALGLQPYVIPLMETLRAGQLRGRLSAKTVFGTGLPASDLQQLWCSFSHMHPVKAARDYLGTMLLASVCRHV